MNLKNIKLFSHNKQERAQQIGVIATSGVFIISFIGSLFIITITKFFSTKAVNLFVSEEKINSLEFLQNKEKLSASLFIIYLIPGTPKDVVTYLIGITDYNIWKFLILTGIARIPSIITSTVCGAALGEKNYMLSAVIFISTVVVGIIGKKLYSRYEKMSITSNVQFNIKLLSFIPIWSIWLYRNVSFWLLLYGQI